MRKFSSKGIWYPFILVFLVFLFGLQGFARPEPQTQTQVKKWAVVISAGANIRTMPSTKGEIIYVAKFGERLELAEDLGVWLKVKLKDGRTGFVWSKLVRVEIEKIVKEAPTAQPAAVKPVQPAQPTTVKPIAAPQAGTQVKEGKKRSMTAFYFIGGLALAGGAAYFLLRKGGLLNKGTATLKVTSNPSEAKVYVDGSEKCTTPCTVENVAPGKHKIKVERELYGKWEQEMELKGYQEYNVDATLAPFKYNFDSCFGSYGSGNGQFNYPWDLTIDNSGNIYVADYGNSRIQKFTSSGNYSAKTLFLYPTGVRFSAHNNTLYAVGPGSSALWKSYPFGSWSHSASLGLSHPYSLGVDSSGNVYIADGGNNRIVKTDASGNYLTQWTVSSPTDAEPGSNGNVYVSAYWKNKVVIYSSSGTKKGEFSRTITGPGGIAVDRMGHVYVTSYYGHKVYKFLSDGTYVLNFGSHGSGNGQFNYPFGIAVYDNGDIVVADVWNHRICRWTLSSETTAAATAKITTSRRKGSSFSGNGFRRGFHGSLGHGIRFHRPRKIKK